jgi:hypothetical protein
MIGPVSTPESQMNRVAPASFTPEARASPGPFMPGKAGSSELCVLMYRPGKVSRKRGPQSFRNPAETTRSGSYEATSLVSASSQASRVG